MSLRGRVRRLEAGRPGGGDPRPPWDELYDFAAGLLGPDPPPYWAPLFREGGEEPDEIEEAIRAVGQLRPRQDVLIKEV